MGRIGTLRAVQAQMAQRGLGASSIAGQALIQGALEIEDYLLHKLMHKQLHHLNKLTYQIDNKELC